MKWNWGTGITLTMALFVAMMAGYMVWAAQEQEQLVSADYYGEEMLYQQRLEQMGRTRALEPAVRLAIEPGALVVFIPRQAWGADATASVRLFRPSDERADRTFPVEPDSAGRWRQDVTGLLRGAYKAQLEWQVGGTVYYLEEPVYLP